MLLSSIFHIIGYSKASHSTSSLVNKEYDPETGVITIKGLGVTEQGIATTTTYGTLYLVD